MMFIDLQSLAVQSLGVMISGLLALLTWAIKRVADRIKRLEDCSVGKREFKELKDSVVLRNEFTALEHRAEVVRKETREQIMLLHTKIDELRSIILQCVQFHNNNNFPPRA